MPCPCTRFAATVVVWTVSMSAHAVPRAVPVEAMGRPAAAREAQPAARQPDVNFVPTPIDVVDDMLAMAGVGASDVVYDLGSGDGRVVIRAAEKFGARGVGIEIDRALIAASYRAAERKGLGARTRFEASDLFTADIGEATVVTLYLGTHINQALLPKLRQELRPGTRIVSHMFRIGTWPPAQRMRRPDGTELFLWTVPRRWKRAPDAPFVPTVPRTVDAMLELAAVRERDVLYDLGSGDGRIAVAAAQKYGARAVGVEIDPPLVDIAREVARDGQVADRVTFIEDDLFTTDLSKATVVTLALPRDMLVQLAPRLERSLRPDARVVTRGFVLPGWTPAATRRTPDGDEIFLFVAGAPRRR